MIALWIVLAWLAVCVVVVIALKRAKGYPQDFEEEMERGRREAAAELEGSPHPPVPSSGGARPAQKHPHPAAPHPQDLPRLG